jgi:cation diffusion facilitator family transporter
VPHTTWDAQRRLTRFAWLAIGTALATLALKTAAWALTGSVGLLSDAAESVVNLAAALVALVVLRITARPADEGHPFGHSKAEYFSAAVEGSLIFVAAIVIVTTSVERLVHPIELDNVGPGVVVSLVAGALNGVVGLVLVRAGSRHRSLTLTADGRHLLTDLWTSVGVIIGVLLVMLTGFERLDPIVALLVGVNIMVTGSRLLAGSVAGLMDHALPDRPRAAVDRVLTELARDHPVSFHAVRTRESGRYQLVSLHVVVPGEWSVGRAYDLLAEVDAAVTAALDNGFVQTQLEPPGVECADGSADLGRPTGQQGGEKTPGDGKDEQHEGAGE